MLASGKCFHDHFLFPTEIQFVLFRKTARRSLLVLQGFASSFVGTVDSLFKGPNRG